MHPLLVHLYPDDRSLDSRNPNCGENYSFIGQLSLTALGLDLISLDIPDNANTKKYVKNRPNNSSSYFVITAKYFSESAFDFC